MNNRSEGVPLLISIYNKLEDNIEAMYSEVDVIMQQQQEGFEYLENKLQTVGASFKQFCSDMVQEIFPQCSDNSAKDEASESSLVHNTEKCDNSAEDEASESSLVQNTGTANKLSREGIDEDQLEKVACNACQLHPSLAQEPEKTSPSGHSKTRSYEEKQMQVEMPDSVTSDENVLSLSELSPTSDELLESSFYEVKQIQIEMSNNFTSDKNNPGLSILSSTSDDLLESSSCTKTTPSVFSSSNSVGSFHSVASGILDFEDFSSEPSAGSTGKLDNSVDDNTYVRSSHRTKLDESCVIVDGSEFSFVSYEAGTLRSWKEQLETLTEKEDVDEHAAESDRQDEEDSAVSSNHESCESDWVIV